MPSRPPAGFAALLHGEAVAYGLRAACRIGVDARGHAAGRAARIEALLDRLELGVGRLPLSTDTVRNHLGTDKKHAGGRLRWVLPTADGVVVRSDVPDAIVATAIDALLGADVHRGCRRR